MARLSERGIARALSLISYLRITLLKAETFLAHGYIGPYHCHRDTSALVDFTDKAQRQLEQLSVVGCLPGDTEQGEYPISTHLNEEHVSHLKLMTVLLRHQTEKFSAYLEDGDKGKESGSEWLDPGNIEECYDHLSELFSHLSDLRDQLDAFSRGEPVPPLPMTPDYDA